MNLNSNILTIYSKTNCPNCDKALALLESYEVPFDVIKVDVIPEARMFLMEKGHRAVPQLYLNGELFVEGGFAGLSKMSREEIINKLSQ